MLLCNIGHAHRIENWRMRETSSLCDRMMDQNWVLKRKRKQVSYGSGLHKKEDSSQPSESSRNSRSVKRPLKDDISISRFSQKIKGHDGYFFECVECDLGGNLLCCDSCPRTYHLECLKPPLKRTPPGKWQCPYCSGKDFVKPLSNADVKLRQTKIKITFGRSKTSHSYPGSDKASLAAPSLLHPKHKSNNKRKVTFSTENPSEEKQSLSSLADTSLSTKTSPSHNDASMDGFATAEDNNVKKKQRPACDRGKGSSKNAHSFVKTLGLSDISPATKPEICKTKMQEKKFILPSAQCSQKFKKKRHKVNRRDRKKRTMGEKGKHVATIVYNNISKETFPAPETSESLQKCKSVGQQISASLIEKKLKLQQNSDQEQPEGTPKGAAVSSPGLDERGLNIDKTLKCYENVLEGTQQVDRILGCRVCSNTVMSSNNSRPIKADISPSHGESGSKLGRLKWETTPCGLSVAEDKAELLEGDCVNGRAIDLKDVEGVHGEECHSNENLVNGNKGKMANNVLDEDGSVKTCRTAEGSSETFKEQILAAGNCEILESSVDAVDTVESIEKSSETDANVELVSVGTCSNSHLIEPFPVSDSDDCKDASQTSLEVQADNSTKNRVVRSTFQDSVPVDNDNILYEFLVKWVGRSNIHNSWVSEPHLRLLAKRKLENYKAKYGTAVLHICEDQWCVPQRVIALRNSKDDTREALVKWCGLPYDECTWERLDEPVMEKYAHLLAEFKNFESQTVVNDARDDSFKLKSDGCEVVPLLEQPKELQGGSLFPHQLEALNWLRKCWHKSKNVILADEMGLGKTVSACAFISSLYFELMAKLPCLVLVPLSTMPNWMAEFAQWTPHLNVVEYHGGAKARSIIRQYEWHACCPNGSSKTTSYKFNVLLTTYEMVLADSSHLRGVPWEVLVVDEGHRLKNSESKLFSLLNTFSFQHRVLLTGTPLQNNIGELYNLLNFLQPASFPSLSAFEEKFKNLTTAEKVEELKKLVAPHMRRRLKKDAMQNIPPKTEHIVPVELSSVQAEYYKAMLTKNYQILRNIGKGGAHQSLLNIVMQLRKVCNHPYLIPGTEPESGSVEFLQEMRIKASGKLTLLHSMLKVLNKEGHRVLIFSQMTKLLDILEDYLSIEFGPGTFERVDGSVSVADRQAAIVRFNQDKSRFAFLLSTRSCGLGINLATADTVIIYDSDFNPHADIQAMNRAHRIGQSNKLLVYRLVVRASVEERILQLAKKKLMLDQLFVNKSESQKEVQDILQWGTEERFSECEEVGAKDPKEGLNCIAEAVADRDFKHRGAGGLGDVYEDRCTEGSSKIVWDENAIMKLLDRSNLQSDISETVDGDLENDMLGSVKPVEWNDEPNEEPGGIELLTGMAGNGSDQAFEVKEDTVASGTEENKWDQLLRVRWEKYQIEEEAALGRGKRLRKAISYRETFAPIPSDALSESADEDEEPRQEYTAAGRALKAKFAKLRARQKERLAQRHNVELERPESLAQLPVPYSKEVENLDASKAGEDTGEQVPSINLEDTKITQPLETKARGDSIPQPGRFSKHGYKRFRSSHLDLSVGPPGALPSDALLSNHQFQSTNYAHLPVLGLCAPNVNQVDSASRSFQPLVRLPSLNHEQSRSNNGIPDFPLPPPSAAGSSSGLNIKDRESSIDPSLLPSTSTDALHQRLKNIIPDSYFPFSNCPPTILKGRGPPDPLDPSGASFSTFKEKMSLPNLFLDNKRPTKFPLPPKNGMKPLHLDLLPSLSLDTSLETFNNTIKDLSNIPLLPGFRQHLGETLKQNKQVPEVPPMLGLGQIPAHPSLPENHKKVLDSIMMGTGSARNKFLKKKVKVDAWSEDELDALWIGVRRHGRGNWESMLRDPKLKFSKHRTPEDLSMRWAEEQLKIFDGPAFVASKHSKLPTFPGIADGVMTRALFGSKFASLGTDPPWLRSHLTDIQLNFRDLMPPIPHMEPGKHFSLLHEGFPSFPSWHLDKHRSSSPVDFGAEPSERLGSLNFPLDLPFQHYLLPGNFSSSSMDSSTSHDLREKQDEQHDKYNKLPNLLDRPLNLLHEPQNNYRSGEPSYRLPLEAKLKQKASGSSMINETVAGSSKVDKLPHWLREAVNVPPCGPPEPELPSTVSAIAQSVRLLYGEEKPTIPPFTIPGPPPFQPKDPRKNLKKKWKLHTLRQATPESASAIKNFDPASSSSIPPALPLVTGASDLHWTDSTVSPPTFNLNLNTPSSSSFASQGKKSGTTLSLSPEVLKLVTSCMAPGLSSSAVPDMPSHSCQNIDMPVSKDLETSEQAGKEMGEDFEGIHGKRKTSRKLLLNGWEKLMEEQIDCAGSGDSSKTHSNECHTDCLEAEENSSEKTLLNGHQSEHEL